MANNATKHRLYREWQSAVKRLETAREAGAADFVIACLAENAEDARSEYLEANQYAA